MGVVFFVWVFMAKQKDDLKNKGDNKDFKDLIYIDDLTSLFNRRYLYQKLKEELFSAEKSNKKLSLFMIDMDNLKGINDTYGHLGGDDALSEIAAILKNNIKEGIIARYAGDEFTVVLPEKDVDNAKNIALSLLKAISEHNFTIRDKTSLKLTFSVGVATFPDDAKDLEGLIGQADKALYTSKRNGRNRVSVVKEITREAETADKTKNLFPCRKFIDRDAPLKEIESILASKDLEKIVLITGAEGVGKTRILNEAALILRKENTLFAKEDLTETEALQPYSAVKRLLNQYFESLDARKIIEIINVLSEEEKAILVKLIPKLKDAVSNLVSLPEYKPVDMFKAVLGLLKRIAKLEPKIVFIIDNFEWVDEASLEVIKFSAKSLNQNIRILAAISKENLNKSKDISPSLIADLSNRQNFEEIMLHNFLISETKEMLRSLLGMLEISEDMLKMIFDSTKGNPLFIEETTRFLINKNILYFKDSRWNFQEFKKDILPASLEFAEKDKIKSQSSEIMNMLNIAALMGQHFNIELLKKIVGEKNEGFILDIIDKAKSAGIIEEDRSKGEDCYSFKNDMVKGLLYDSGEKEKIREAHLKLASILESINTTQLDQYAGQLMYHINRSEKPDVIKEYSNRFKLLRDKVFSKNDVLKFLAEMRLGEGAEIAGAVSVEELMEEPLSPKSMANIQNAIISFRAAMINALLYPPDNQMRLDSEKEAYSRLTEIFENDKSLTFSNIDGRLIVNGQEIEKKEFRSTLGFAFAGLLSDHLISSITFKRGLQKKELILFLEFLGKKDDFLKAKGGFPNLLKENHIDSIKINQVHYEKASDIAKKIKATQNKLRNLVLKDPSLKAIFNTENDSLVFNSNMASNLSQTIDGLKNILKNVSETKNPIPEKADMVAEIVNNIGNTVSEAKPEMWEKYKSDIKNIMLSLEPFLRNETLKKMGSSENKERSVFSDLIKEFSMEDVVKVFRDEHKLKNSQEELKKLADSVLPSVSDVSYEADFKKELLKLGLSKNEIEELFKKGPDNAVPSSKIDEFLSNVTDALSNKDALPRNDEELSKNIALVLEGLFLKNEFDKVSALIKKLILNLEESSISIRLVAAKNLEPTIDVILNKEKFDILNEIAQSIIKRLSLEDNQKVYEFLVNDISKLVVGLLYKENYKLAKDIIKILKDKFSINKEEIFKFEFGNKDIKNVFTNICDRKNLENMILISKGKIESKYKSSLDIFCELGKYAASSLIDMLRYDDKKKDPFEVFMVRKTIAVIFRHLGPDALKMLQSNLNDKDTNLVRNIVEVLGFMEDKSFIPDFRLSLNSQDSKVRVETISAIKKIGGAESFKLLLEAMKDKILEVKLKALYALGDIGDESVLQALKESKDFLIDKELKLTIEKLKTKLKK